MNGFIMAAQLILGLSLLIFFHELGHYLAARMFGIRVDKFYLFFDAYNFRLFKFKIGDTEYGMGWLPLGGYCKIAGMVDESMDKETLKEEPKSYEYRSKPAWQRFIVITAGVIMNLIIGIFLFAMLLFSQEKQYLSVGEVNVYGVYASPLAKDLGFKTGDRIIEVNGEKVSRFADVQNMRILFGGSINIERTLVDQNGEKKEIVKDIEIPKDAYRQAIDRNSVPLLDVTAYALSIDTVFGEFPAQKAGLQKGDIILGIDTMKGILFGDFRQYVRSHPMDSMSVCFLRGKDTLYRNMQLDSSGYVGLLSVPPYKYSPYTFANSFYYGTKDAFDLIITNAKGLGKVVTGKEKVSESLQGPIGIAQIYGSVWVWPRFIYITGMLSLILAFMNILPIPGLDGGHMMFTLYEMVTRRKPSDSVVEKSQVVGMIILVALMIFAFGNDIIKLF